jgi:hypothetical protein
MVSEYRPPPLVIEDRERVDAAGDVPHAGHVVTPKGDYPSIICTRLEGGTATRPQKRFRCRGRNLSPQNSKKRLCTLFKAVYLNSIWRDVYRRLIDKSKPLKGDDRRDVAQRLWVLLEQAEKVSEPVDVSRFNPDDNTRADLSAPSTKLSPP